MTKLQLECLKDEFYSLKRCFRTFMSMLGPRGVHGRDDKKYQTLMGWVLPDPRNNRGGYRFW